MPPKRKPEYARGNCNCGAHGRTRPFHNKRIEPLLRPYPIKKRGNSKDGQGDKNNAAEDGADTPSQICCVAREQKKYARNAERQKKKNPLKNQLNTKIGPNIHENSYAGKNSKGQL